MLREKQMSVSRELEEKQTTCQQLQTSAEELEVQIDTLSEERQRVSFQHLKYNSHPVLKDCLISWSSSFARNLRGGRWEKVFSTFPAHFRLSSHHPSLRKQTTFHDATTSSPAKWRLRNECRNFILMTRSGWCFWLVLPRGIFASTNQKHYPDLVSDASSVWNFCAHFSDVISRGNQWWRREMSAVFSGYHSLLVTERDLCREEGWQHLRKRPPFFAYWVTRGTSVPW